MDPILIRGLSNRFAVEANVEINKMLRQKVFEVEWGEQVYPQSWAETSPYEA